MLYTNTMRSLLLVLLSTLMFLAGCGRSVSARLQNGANGDVRADFAQAGGDANAGGGQKNYVLAPLPIKPLVESKAKNTPTIEATPHSYTVDIKTKRITLTADLQVDGTNLGLINFSGTVNEKEHLAHLQSNDRNTQATVLCLDIANCQKAVVVIYHRYKDQNLEVQFQTQGQSIPGITSIGIDNDDTTSLPVRPPMHNTPIGPSRPPQNQKPPSQPPPKPVDLEEDDAEEGESAGFVGQVPPDLRPLNSPMTSGTLPQAIGRQSDGRLINAEMLPIEGKGFVRMIQDASANAWGTSLLIRILTTASSELAEKYPDRPPLLVGDISKKTGGKLGSHKSHRNGLDADIGFPRKSGIMHWFQTAVLGRNNVDNRLDLERLLMFAKLMVSSKYLINIYAATPIKNAVCQYARDIGEFSNDPNSLTFKALSSIFFVEGHHDHMHVRLQCPSTSPHCEKTNPVLPKIGTGCPNN